MFSLGLLDLILYYGESIVIIVDIDLQYIVLTRLTWNRLFGNDKGVGVDIDLQYIVGGSIGKKLIFS